MRNKVLAAHSRLFGVLFAAILSVFSLPAASPRVNGIEPPGWWAGHSHNPVRLLISGSHLSGARVEAPADFVVSEVRSSDNGNYLFLNLRIPENARTGAVPLRVIAAGGETQAGFAVMPRFAPSARAQGISTDDVIYLIVTDRFANGDPNNDDPAISRGLRNRGQLRRYHGGDFQGIINHLGYLKELGVTALWITPWYDNVNHLNWIQSYSPDYTNSPVREPSADYHGYGVVDFYKTEEHFGDLQSLQQLVDVAHATGMKVIQDQVANTTSPYHPWLTNLPTPTWFNGNTTNHLANSFQTWTITVPNPPADKLRSTIEGWLFDVLPDLNQNDPEMATYLIQNSLWWIGVTGVDAVRQDALPYVPRAFWSRWAPMVKREYPRVTILGEIWDADPKRIAFFQGGKKRFDGLDSGMDTLFDFPLHYAIRDVFIGAKPMTRLTETLAADASYVAADRLVTFLGLHDHQRFISDPDATVDGLKLAFAFLFTTRGTPLIYYGDEIALRGGYDPDNRRDFPGGWPGDPQNAFEAVNRTPEQEEMHAWVAKLLLLRKELAPLRHGKLANLLVNRDTYAFARVTGESFAVVLFNNSTRRQRVEAPLGNLATRTRHALTDHLGTLGTVKITDDTLRVNLAPRSVVLLTP